MKSRRLRVGVVILLALLAARLFLHHAIGQTLYAQYPLVDAFTYWQQAEALWDGRNPFGEGLYQPPAYPYFIYAVSHLWGGPELSAIRWVQTGMGVVTCLGVWWVGNKIGDRIDAYWCGCVAMVVYGFYPSVLLFEQDWLTPALSNMLMVFGLMGFIFSRPWSVLLGAVCLGAAISVHPSLLLLGMMSIFWCWKQKIKLWIPILGMALSLAPTTIWNIQDGRPALVSHNSGINLYIGNGVDWNDTIFLRPGLEFRRWVMQASPAKRSLEERNQYWRQETINEVVAAPHKWLGAILTKSYWSIHNTEIPRNEDYRCRTDEPILKWVQWIPLSYGVLFPLAVMGAWCCRKTSKDDLISGLPLLWISVHAPLIIFFVSDRYRVATIPFIAILSGVGLSALRRQMKGRVVMLLVGLGLLTLLPIDARTQKSEAWCSHIQGNLAFMDEQWTLSAERYRHSLDLYPDNLSAHLYLGSLAQRRNDLTEARAYYLTVLEGYPTHYPTLSAMAGVCEKMNDWSCATDMLTRAYQVPGNRIGVGIRLFKLLIQLNRENEAIQFVQAESSLWNHREVRKWREQKGL